MPLSLVLGVQTEWVNEIHSTLFHHHKCTDCVGTKPMGMHLDYFDRKGSSHEPCIILRKRLLAVNNMMAVALCHPIADLKHAWYAGPTSHKKKIPDVSGSSFLHMSHTAM